MITQTTFHFQFPTFLHFILLCRTSFTRSTTFLWSSSFRLAAPSSTPFIQYIHYTNSAHVQTILSFCFLTLSPNLSCPSDVVMFILIHAGLSQWKSWHFQLCLLSYLSVPTSSNYTSLVNFVNFPFHSWCYPVTGICLHPLHFFYYYYFFFLAKKVSGTTLKLFKTLNPPRIRRIQFLLNYSCC